MCAEIKKSAGVASLHREEYVTDLDVVSHNSVFGK